MADGPGRGIGRNEAQFELDPDLVGVSPGDPSANRWFLVVAHGDPVTRLRVEVRIRRAGAVADPRLDDKIGTNRRGVVPQVVALDVHVAHDTSVTRGPIARVGDRTLEVGPNSIELGGRRCCKDDRPMR